MHDATPSITGGMGRLDAVIEIKRADTGQVDFYNLVGFANPADLENLLSNFPGSITLGEASASLTRTVAIEDLTDQTAIVDQGAVTSTVTIDGMVTARTYSDGVVQRNIWGSVEEAQAFADSVNEQEGAK